LEKIEMKKTLVAMAVIATTSAYAQSTVSIDGGFDAGFMQINYKGADNTVKGFNGNGSSTSQINFRGTEDLGGGLKANFRFESDFNAVSTYANTGLASSTNASIASQSINSVGSTFGNGEVRVGLESPSFGRFDIGSVNYNSLTTYGTGQPFGTAIGSGFRTLFINDIQATSQVRAENAIKFTTPTLNGFTGSIYKSYKQTKATEQTAVTSASTVGLMAQANAFSTSMGAYDQQGTSELGLNFANGPIAASFSSLKVDVNGVQTLQSSDAAAAASSSTVTTAAVKYTLGNAAISVLNQTNKNNISSVNTTANTYSVAYTMGSTVLMAQLGEGKANVGTYNGSKSKIIGLGADYNLSKRTALYFRSESIDDNARMGNSSVNPNAIANTTALNALTDQKFGRTAIGLRHTF
jgi:predicted porin